MKTVYIDAYSGIAGDMMIGALLSLLASDVGAETAESKFRSELAKIPLKEYDVKIRSDSKGGISGIAFRVHEHQHEHVHRGLHDIQTIIMNSSLDPRVARETLRAFALLAEAEAKVHGTTVDKIHFHEVGAIDSIVDITGVFILMNLLGWPRVISSPLNVGSGTVRCAHGVLPVPAPATIELLQGIPVYSLGSPMERVTPTGALIVRCLTAAFSAMPPGKVKSVGYGLGEKDCPDIPNALRLVYLDNKDECESDFCALLETNIDDMNPQDFSPAIDKLFEAGALDVWIEPILMKKGRPGQKLCCLSRAEDDFSEIILLHTTTQGVRKSTVSRSKLSWSIEEIESPIGKFRVKVSQLGGRTLRCVPEHDDLKRIAFENNLSLYDVRVQVVKFIEQRGSFF